MRGQLVTVCSIFLLVGGLCFLPVVTAGLDGAGTQPAEAADMLTSAEPLSSNETPVTTSETRFSAESPLTATETSTATPLSSDDDITMTTTLDRTPDRTGEITATVSFAFPSRVTELTALLPDGADVTEADGFRREAATTYEWDGRTSQPSVTFRVNANQRSDREGPLAETGSFLFADTEDWSLVRIPRTTISGRYTGSTEPRLVRETAIDGPGAAGDRMAFLGENEIKTHTAHGQTFDLVVPEAADLAADPDEIFESVAYASDRLRAGARDETVFMIAAPTDQVDWAARGLQVGPSDLWVQDTERLDTPSNVWVHEYIHTRQEYAAADDFRWFTEASATYYAALLTLEEERIDFERFQRFLQQGEREPQSTSVMTDPDSWENFADYTKGALVGGEIDRQIRLTSESESSLDDVFRAANSHDGEFRARDFRRAVRTAANSEVEAEATRLTATDAVPTMWDGDAHAAAFGQQPARFTYQLADTDPITASGPDRVESVTPPLALVEGETVTVAMTVENVGGTVGNYELSFRVNGAETLRTGRLTAGETANHQFEHTFDRAGNYTVSVGDEQFDVTVSPADTDSIVPPVDSDQPIVEEVPGFGVGVALLAFVAVSVLARVRTQ